METNKPAAPAVGEPVLKTELVQNIPIRQPAPSQGGNPMTAAPAPAADKTADAKMDRVLLEVNQNVKLPVAKAPAKKVPLRERLGLAKKQKAKKPAASPAVIRPKPYLAIAATALITAALVIAAVMAFWHSGAQDNGKPASAGVVGTSDSSGNAIQAAGGKLVTPGDIKDFEAKLQSQINGLSDQQDFDPSVLSDKSLGL